MREKTRKPSALNVVFQVSLSCKPFKVIQITVTLGKLKKKSTVYDPSLILSLKNYQINAPHLTSVINVILIMGYFANNSWSPA